MFKPLAQVTQRDTRYDLLMVPDGQGGMRNIELADYYADVAAISLPASAPKEVETIFDRARHAYLYAWFDYELTPLAAQQALAALEKALKLRRLGTNKQTLRPLLEEAVRQGLVPAKWGRADLPEAVATFRNHWAHGSDHFGTPNMALDVLGLSASLIRRLFP